MLYLLFVVVFLILWGALDMALPRIWAALQSAAGKAAASSMRYGWIKRAIHVASPLRDYLPVILTLVAGLLLAGWAGESFLDLAESVRANSAEMQQADARIHNWAVAHRNDSATSFFDLMSVIGGPSGVTAIALAALIALLARKHLHRSAYLILTIAGGGAIDWQLKKSFARARPDVAEMLMSAHGYSFPSGHAMGSTVLFLTLSYLAFRIFEAWRWKAAAASLSVTLILSVALSRVYLGVHWISDVTAGIIAGVLWVSMTTVAYETFRRIHLIRVMRAAPATESAADDRVPPIRSTPA